MKTRRIRRKHSLTAKYILFAIASLLLAVVGLVALTLFGTYVLKLPGTGSNQFYTALQALRLLFGSAEIPILSWFVIFAALFIGIFILFSRRSTRRLDKVAQAVRAIAQGQLDVRVRVVTHDDIGVLEDNINEMAARIASAFEIQRQAERGKDEFIANIAHDLRTPLMSVAGYLAWIDEQQLPPDQMHRYATIAYEKTRRIQQLVDDLFTLSRLSTKQLDFAPTTFDAQKFLMQVQEECYPLLHEADMALQLHLPPLPIQLYADGDLLSRVFDNLITNAIRYAKAGKSIDIYAIEYPQWHLFSVVSHANPIPEAELERIFDKLYRLEKSRASGSGGTGLGLPISRSIAQLHGGHLKARRIQGGTSFDLWLPRHSFGTPS